MKLLSTVFCFFILSSVVCYSNDRLENELINLIHENCGSYSLLRDRDIEVDLRKYLKKDIKDNQPGYVAGNFRHPQVWDCFAIIKECKNQNSCKYRLILVTGINTLKPQFRIIEEMNEVEGGSIYYLRYVKRETKPNLFNNEWVDMTSNGVALVKDGSFEKVYFWKKGKLKVILTST
jgi:hypothetical protein